MEETALFCILLVCMISFLNHAAAIYGTDCVTPLQQAGTCVPIRSCANILDIVQRSGSEQADVTLVRSSHCGVVENVHHVCCAAEHVQLNTFGLELLQNATCGQFSFPKVANGQQAELFTFPWMTLLKYNTGKPFRCGGTLISERYVLTAAHCVYGLEDSLTEVRLGEYNITSEVDCKVAGKILDCAGPVEDVPIEKIIMHGSYQQNKLHHDIALLRLNRTIDFKRHIRPICLPITPLLMTKVRDEYYIAGWGNTELGITSDVLMWTALPIRQRDDCERAFRLQHLTQGHICAGGLDLMDSCKGDSGGPIKQIDIYNKRVRMIQFGIVSLGTITCGEQNLPGVYTNVSHYMQWISDNMAIYGGNN